MDIVNNDKMQMLYRMDGFGKQLQHKEFYRQIDDIIQVGLRRYKEKYSVGQEKKEPFILYEKYSRRDVCFLMNCERDMSSTMYGMKRIGEDVFIFITYKNEKNLSEGKIYADGKPDYADEFEDNMIFCWDSQLGRGVHSSYVAEVVSAPRKHLFVKKSDAEINFYYMGQFDILEMEPARKKDKNGRERDIAKFRMKMHHAVRADLLHYLQSSIETKDVKAG